MDVTDCEGDFAEVPQAAEHFGRLDLVINNAGYGQFGMIEELSEEEFRAQLETNVFGVTDASVPLDRNPMTHQRIQTVRPEYTASFQ